MQGNLFFSYDFSVANKDLHFTLNCGIVWAKKKERYLERGNWYEKENFYIVIFTIKCLWF